MFLSISSEEFLNSPKSVTSILFIKEVGCKYCEAAESLLTEGKVVQRFTTIAFFEVRINDEPDLPTKLGLVGVPSFLKVEPSGRRRVLSGFDSLDAFESFLGVAPEVST